MYYNINMPFFSVDFFKDYFDSSEFRKMTLVLLCAMNTLIYTVQYSIKLLSDFGLKTCHATFFQIVGFKQYTHAFIIGTDLLNIGQWF